MAAAVGTLLSLPLPLVIGRLSDRLGRKPLLLLCFLTTLPGLIILAAAKDSWHFWLASILQTGIGLSVVVGAALMTDIFPDESLDTALSLLTATPWIGIVCLLKTVWHCHRAWTGSRGRTLRPTNLYFLDSSTPYQLITYSASKGLEKLIWKSAY